MKRKLFIMLTLMFTVLASTLITVMVPVVAILFSLLYLSSSPLLTDHVNVLVALVAEL